MCCAHCQMSTHSRITDLHTFATFRQTVIFALFAFMSSFAVITNLPRSSHCNWTNGIFWLALYFRRWPSTILKSLLLKKKPIANAAARMRRQMGFPICRARNSCVALEVAMCFAVNPMRYCIVAHMFHRRPHHTNNSCIRRMEFVGIIKHRKACRRNGQRKNKPKSKRKSFQSLSVIKHILFALLEVKANSLAAQFIAFVAYNSRQFGYYFITHTLKRQVIDVLPNVRTFIVSAIGCASFVYET